MQKDELLERIERNIRTKPLDKVKTMALFAHKDIIKSTQLSGATQTTKNAHGGVISSIIRTKIDGNDLFKTLPRVDGDLRITLNTDLISREEFKKVLTKIDRNIVEDAEEATLKL